MKNLLKNLALLAISTIVMVTVAELGARLAFPTWAPRTGRLADLWRFDADYGWSHVPGTDGPFRSHAFNTHVAINADGFRGPQVKAKDPARVRIVLVGDSYVFGYGVEYEETFGARLEAMCPGLDVVNLGVSGYSTDQEFLLFKERGVSYDPDIVILVMVDNDYEGNASSKAYVYYQKPAFIVRNNRLVLTNRPVRPPTLPVRWVAGIARHSYLLNQVNRTIQGIKAQRRSERAVDQPPRANGNRTAIGRTFPSSPAESLTAAILLNFVEAVEAVDARMLIVMAEEQAGRARGVAQLLSKGTVPVIQMDEFIPPSDYGRYRLIGDPHWNAAGHNLVARVILQRLLATGMVNKNTCLLSSSDAPSDTASRP